MEEMHGLWCKVAVQMLIKITDTEGVIKFKHAEKRAYIAKMCSNNVQDPSNKRGTQRLIDKGESTSLLPG